MHTSEVFFTCLVLFVSHSSRCVLICSVGWWGFGAAADYGWAKIAYENLGFMFATGKMHKGEQLSNIQIRM
jgi:hypothetical protein